jgi:hypothetical protein
MVVINLWCLRVIARRQDFLAPRVELIVIHKHLRAAVIPAVPYLALGGKQADRQTFQVFKTWKV